MSKQTGGPAFPVADGAAHRIAMQTAGDDEAKYIAESEKALSGMTLRDYMAAKALQGLCANPGGPFQANDMSGWAIVNCELDDIATESYKLADAMLRAREAS